MTAAMARQVLAATLPTALVLILCGCTAGPVDIPRESTLSPTTAAPTTAAPTTPASDAPTEPLARCLARSGSTTRPPDIEMTADTDPAAIAARRAEQLRFDVVLLECQHALSATPAP